MAGVHLISKKNRRVSRAAFAEINVTPLVDVMLVLLLIFMLTAPMLTVGVPVELPKTSAAKLNDQVEPLVITVDSTGRMFIQETEVSQELLVPRLQAITQNNPEAKIYVRGDKNLAYGKVMETMGAIAAAGFTKVSLLAELPPQGGAKNSKQANPAGTAPKKQSSSVAPKTPAKPVQQQPTKKR